MGRVYQQYLDSHKIFRCKKCKAHLSISEYIVSKNFQGRTGKAYLFEKAANVCSGPAEERMLMTGLHVVVDLYCNVCGCPVGWKYQDAHEDSQKYKIGKFILELAKTQRDRKGPTSSMST